MREQIFAITVGAALALGVAPGVAAPVVAAVQEKEAAPAPAPTPEEIQELRAASATKEPAARVTAIRGFIAKYPKSRLQPVAYQALMGALAAAKAPASEIVAATDTATALAEKSAVAQAMIYNQAAMALADRGEALDKALAYAERALAAFPADDEEAAEMRSNVRDTLGWVLVQRGDYAKAIEELSAVAKALPGNQEVLYHLGLAYEKAGKTDEAIETFVKAEAVYLGQDERAKEPLRALYLKQHGSLAGLDAKLAAARDASREEVVFSSRRWEKPAPAWELKTLDGKPVKLADYKGKVVVMDFWGSWCPPCRAELPYFQALHEKYKGKNVVFLGMNWEQPGEPETRLKLATDFMAKNNYTFPVVVDHDRVAVKAYEVPGFPTVFLIDETGKIRFRNIGYEEGVDKILEAQLDSMLK